MDKAYGQGSLHPLLYPPLLKKGKYTSEMSHFVFAQSMTFGLTHIWPHLLPTTAQVQSGFLGLQSTLLWRPPTEKQCVYYTADHASRTVLANSLLHI